MEQRKQALPIVIKRHIIVTKVSASTEVPLWEPRQQVVPECRAQHGEDEALGAGV